MTTDVPGTGRGARFDDGSALAARLIAGPLLWGALGYLADSLLGIGPALLPAGIVLGAVLSIYLVIVRTSGDPTTPTTRNAMTTDGGRDDAR